MAFTSGIAAYRDDEAAYPGWPGRRALEGEWETRENAPTQTAGGSPDSEPFLSLACGGVE